TPNVASSPHSNHHPPPISPSPGLSPGSGRPEEENREASPDLTTYLCGPNDHPPSKGTRPRNGRERGFSELSEASIIICTSGEVPERPIGPVSKTGDGATRPRVRIPPSPLKKTQPS